MSNVYLIVSKDPQVTEFQINQILSKEKEIEKVSYDLLETPIDRLIEDLDTYNFLSSKKVILGWNATFLAKDSSLKEVTHHLERLEKYLDHPSPENILILVAEEIDKRKKIVTKLCEKGTLIQKEESIKEMVKQRLDGYEMDTRTIDFLIEYCGQNPSIVLNELEKLKLYRVEEKKITANDIKEIVRKNWEENIYSLVDAILTGKKKEAFEMYQDLLLHGEQSSSVLTKLANKIRLIYQTKILLQKGWSDQEIGTKLGMHPYPVKLAREASYGYTEEMLLEYLEKLAQVDYDMKSGNGNAELAFEIFIASM